MCNLSPNGDSGDTERNTIRCGQTFCFVSDEIFDAASQLKELTFNSV